MTIRAHRSERSRHLVLRISSGEPLPDALAAKLRDEQVACAWLRASGVLADIELRAFNAELGGLGTARRIVGPVQVIALEGAAGVGPEGEPAVSLRAVLARETDRGLETLAGEIATARAIAIEVFVTVLDDVTLERRFDEPTGLWFFATGPAATEPPLARVPAAAATKAAPSAWSAALEASADAPDTRARDGRERHAPRAAGSAVQVPQRPARPQPDLDTPVPEAGDVVEHFAFGRCDVLKSDGERLHLKVHKDGRIREIALEMLRTTQLDESNGRRRFKLERRM